jgi:hypothetical protein
VAQSSLKHGKGRHSQIEFPDRCTTGAANTWTKDPPTPRES